MRRAALDFGFIISFAGNITFPKAQNIRDAAAWFRWIACSSRLIAHILRQYPIAVKRNEPAFVVEVAKTIGRLRGPFL